MTLAGRRHSGDSGLGGSGREKAESSRNNVQRILDELRNPVGPDVIEVGDLPAHVLSRWPNRSTDRGIITRQQRNHYLDEHPEMVAFEHLVVSGLVDPDAVAEMLDVDNTAMIYKREDDRHDIAIVVSISHDPALANSVITARRQHRSRRAKPRSRNLVFWERGAEE